MILITLLTVNIKQSVLLDPQSLKQTFITGTPFFRFILCCLHVMDQLLHFEISFWRFRYTIQLFQFGLSLSRNREFYFVVLLNPFSNTFFYFLAIYISPHFYNQFKILQLLLIIRFGPHFLPNSFEQKISIFFC